MFGIEDDLYDQINQLQQQNKELQDKLDKLVEMYKQQDAALNRLDDYIRQMRVRGIIDMKEMIDFLKVFNARSVIAEMGKG